MKCDKAPAERLDYKWDLDKWLGVGEMITGAPSVVSSPTGLTVETPSITDAGRSVTAFVTGGTLGQTYELVCHMLTSAGRQPERTITINVTHR